MKKIKRKIKLWILRRIFGVKRIKSPIEILWDMIDEENRNGSATYENGEPAPDCCKIEAWEQAIERLKKEYYGAFSERRR